MQYFEFSFSISQNGCPIKAWEPSLLYYFTHKHYASNIFQSRTKQIDCRIDISSQRITLPPRSQSGVTGADVVGGANVVQSETFIGSRVWDTLLNRTFIGPTTRTSFKFRAFSRGWWGANIRINCSTSSGMVSAPSVPVNTRTKFTFEGFSLKLSKLHNFFKNYQ